MSRLNDGLPSDRGPKFQHHRLRLFARRRWLRDQLCSRLYGLEERAMDTPTTTLTNHIQPIRCPLCAERAYIIRRVLDALKLDGSEVWTFQCVNGHDTEKSGKQ